MTSVPSYPETSSNSPSVPVFSGRTVLQVKLQASLCRLLPVFLVILVFFPSAELSGNPSASSGEGRGRGLSSLLSGWLHLLDEREGSKFEIRAARIIGHASQVPRDLRAVFLDLSEG